MIPVLEPLFCPCCTPAILHTLAQSGLQSLTQPLNVLGTGALSLLVKLEENSRSLDNFSKQEHD